MEKNIKGIHHITAIAGDAKRNLQFYTKVLGLRLVKKTVNFDDPGTYHLYFGNEAGNPGTILTFFPWQDVIQGHRGPGQVTEIAFSVPPDSFDFWIDRFKRENVIYNMPSKRFDEEYLVFLDPDGLKLELVANDKDKRRPYTIDGIDEAKAIRGFYNATISLEGYERTAKVLTEVFGYKLTKEHVNRFRFEIEAEDNASIIDLVCLPGERTGLVAGGSVHHIAFRVENDDIQAYFRHELVQRGLDPTPQIDRNYFKSVYFREPSGVLFEIATDPPGFTVDEPLEQLGKNLMLPEMYEFQRNEIEMVLPSI